MKRDDVRRLLDRVGVLRHRCDLDLLVFFGRHPRCLLASETLAAFLGYDLKDIAESLDVLLTAGVLKRSQTPAHAARLYVFAAEAAGGGWGPSLLRLASTREGWLALREALLPRTPKTGGEGEALAAEASPKRGPRALVRPRLPEDASGSNAC